MSECFVLPLTFLSCHCDGRRRQVSYFVVCFGLCLPIFAFPLLSVHPSEAGLPFGQRFGVRANLWIVIYSFIGNYWWAEQRRPRLLLLYRYQRQPPSSSDDMTLYCTLSKKSHKRFPVYFLFFRRNIGCGCCAVGNWC